MTGAPSSLRRFAAPNVDPLSLWSDTQARFYWQERGEDCWLGMGVARRWSARRAEQLPALAAEAEATLRRLGAQDGLRPRVFVQIAFEGSAELVLPRWTYIPERGALLGVDAPPGSEAPLLAALQAAAAGGAPRDPAHAAGPSSTDPGVPTIDPAAGAAAPDPATARGAGTAGGSQRIELRRPPAEVYRAQVEQLRARIQAGEVDKVVLSRDTELVAHDGRFRPAALLGRLAHEPEESVRFAVQLEPGVCFLGLTPERLLRRRGDALLTEALAGTQPRGGAEALLASAKDRQEQAYVVEFIRRQLEPFCARLDVGEPRAQRLTHMVHIKTPIHGQLAGPRPLMELVQAVHPTPAVAGLPREAALAAIAEIEGRPRGPYASALGWFEAGGDGDVWVGLRSALIEGHRARLFVGGGIVQGSDPEAEWQETLLKERTMLRALEAECA